MIGAPLKPLQKASGVDTILKRSDEAGDALVDFQEDRSNVLAGGQLDKIH